MFTVQMCTRVQCTRVKIRGTQAPKMAARDASSRVTEPKIGSALHATQHLASTVQAFWLIHPISYSNAVNWISSKLLKWHYSHKNLCVHMTCVIWTHAEFIFLIEIYGAFCSPVKNTFIENVFFCTINLQYDALQCKLVMRTVSRETKFIPLGSCNITVWSLD